MGIDLEPKGWVRRTMITTQKWGFGCIAPWLITWRAWLWVYWMSKYGHANRRSCDRVQKEASWPWKKRRVESGCKVFNKPSARKIGCPTPKWSVLGIVRPTSMSYSSWRGTKD